MNIFLIRHGESDLNTGKNYETKLPDNKIALTDKGIEQCHKAGAQFKAYCNKNNINLNKTKMYVSPYERTRMTASLINEHLHIEDVAENILLCEQNYGLFSEIPKKERFDALPQPAEYYYRYKDNDSMFYAKTPEGESPFDVAVRMKLFIIEQLQNCSQYENIIIISHGAAIRAFMIAYMNYSPEWFNKEPNVDNCAIRYVCDNPIRQDMGYICRENDTEDE